MKEGERKDERKDKRKDKRKERRNGGNRMKMDGKCSLY